MPSSKHNSTAGMRAKTRKYNDEIRGTQEQWAGINIAVDEVRQLLLTATTSFKHAEELTKTDSISDDLKTTLIPVVKQANLILHHLTVVYKDVVKTIPQNTGKDNIKDPDVFMEYLDCGQKLDVIRENIQNQLLPIQAQLLALIPGAKLQ